MCLNPVFIDEIQNTPKVIVILGYFQEEAKEIFVMHTG